MISESDTLRVPHCTENRCVYLPELGLESLSRWAAPTPSGVGGESRSDGASQDRADQREVLPPQDEEWADPSPELPPQASVVL